MKAFTRAHLLCRGHNLFLFILSLIELPNILWKVIDNFFFVVSQREILIFFCFESVKKMQIPHLYLLYRGLCI